MLKPGKTFKLSKTAKRMIALMKGSTSEQRNQYKRMMIDAELCGAIQPKREKRPSGPQGN
jgi:allophanate hydrolase subunit 2